MASDLIIQLPKLSQEITINKEWIEKREGLIASANGILITSDETYKSGSELLNQITKTSNQLEKMRKELSDPFTEAQKLIKRKADEVREPLEQKKSELQTKLSNFVIIQRKAAEKAKREAEERAQAEIERQLSEKKSLEDAGLIEEETPFVPELSALPVAAIVEPPKSFATKTQDDVVWELEDETHIPEAFKSFDERKVNAWLRENKPRLLKLLSDNPGVGTTFINGIHFKLKLKITGIG